MLIDRVLYPVTSLGPGRRLAIWTVGCNRRCENCANPELWDFNYDKNINIEELLKIIKGIATKHSVDGITITGGEPFEQVEELEELLKGIEHIFKDILIFSGYTLKQLKTKNLFNIDTVLNKIAVLIDGEYIDEKNDNSSSLRGSANQKIYILKPDFIKRYSEYIAKGRTVQNVFYKNNLISIGIHNRL